MGLKELRQKLKWLDPFTYVDLWVMPKVNPNNNKAIETVVYVVFAFIFALALYALLGLILWTKNPLVIVVSGSMQPNLYRGDVVVMHGLSPQDIRGAAIEIDTDLSGKSLSEFAAIDYAGQTISIAGQSIPLNQSGDTVVYYSDLSGVQIIHRVVANIKTPQGHYLLTKGDNQATNQFVDQDCGQVYHQQLHNQSLVNAPKQWFQLSGEEYCYCTLPPKNEVVKPKKEPPARGRRTIQVASLKSDQAARDLVARLGKMRYEAYKVTVNLPGNGTYHRVRVGHYDNPTEARQVAALLREDNFEAVVIEE